MAPLAMCYGQCIPARGPNARCYGQYIPVRGPTHHIVDTLSRYVLCDFVMNVTSSIGHHIRSMYYLFTLSLGPRIMLPITLTRMFRPRIHMHMSYYTGM